MSKWLEIIRARGQKVQAQAKLVSDQTSRTPASLPRPSGPPRREPRTEVTGTLSSEMLRILNLAYCTHIDYGKTLSGPRGIIRCPQPDDYELELLNHAPVPGFKLRATQIDSAWTYETTGGLLANQGVGWGKAVCDFLCARIAHVKRGHRKVAICTDSALIDQLVDKDLPQARRWLNLDDCAFYPVRGDLAQRNKAVDHGLPGIYIIAYSTFSTTTGFELIKKIGATAWILDEAHKLSRADAARTKRWITAVREIEEQLPPEHVGIEVVPLSGTITKKSIGDYAHLAQAALREGSPLPTSAAAISEFSNVIDAGAMTRGDSKREFTGMLQWALSQGMKLPDSPARLTTQEIMREAFRFRMNSAPGVIATSDQSVGCSLIIRWQEPRMPADESGTKMRQLMTNIVTLDETPDGDVIDWAIHRFKWLYELTSGFYNSLFWPTPETLMERRGVTREEAVELIKAAVAHHALLQIYHKNLRAFLDAGHIPGCDSPMLVGGWIKRKVDSLTSGTEYSGPRLPDRLIGAWKDAHEAYYDDLPKRESKPVRVCDYRIKAAVEWAKDAKEGIIWHYHPEVGRWISEYLTTAGIQHSYAPAGDNESVYNKGIVVASMIAHGIGKNLQHQSQQLFAEWNREAAKLEQILGRTHRAGQMADEVTADVFVVNGFDLAMFNASLSDSDYIQSSTGQSQKLCFANYSPLVPPTNPRLYMKLGLVDKPSQSVIVDSYDQITDDDVVAAMVRPIAYANDGKFKLNSKRTKSREGVF